MNVIALNLGMILKTSAYLDVPIRERKQAQRPVVTGLLHTFAKDNFSLSSGFNVAGLAGWEGWPPDRQSV
jgi:hypothetical protein